MQHPTIRQLPTFSFAHKFSMVGYSARITLRPQQMEISMITEGELTVLHNGAQDVAKKGDIICNLGQVLDVSYAGYHAHRTACFFVETAPDVPPLDFPIVIHAPQNSAACLRLIDKIIAAGVLDPEDHLKLSGLFLQLLGEVADACRGGGTVHSPGERRYVDSAKRYISDHINEPIAQSDIAAFLGITPEYLCSVFKKCEGCSVMRFINEIKLTHVRSLMENDRLTLSQAAAQYGFSDPNYVSKLYRRYFNETITGAVKISKRTHAQWVDESEA